MCAQKRGEIMSPKTGRPKLENPINIRTSVRLDAETDKKLIEYCKMHNITKGEAIRKGVHLLLGQK
jgi:Ribbon-helix-helix protein, copG family.